MARERTGLFFLEGIRFLAEATHHQFPLETLIVASQLLTHPFGQKLVRLQRRQGVPCLEVTPDVFMSLSTAEEPQWVAAVARQRWERLERMPPDEGLCWVAVDTVQSPGNLGCLVRTSEAVGGAGVILLSKTTDPYHPAAVRATMGAIFAQRFARATPAELLAWKERHGGLLVGTSPHAATDYRAVRYRPPVVLFMGWERQGLSAEQKALCDVLVRIPMVGRSDSLNLAVATGVLLYEVFNQRLAAGTGPAAPGPVPPASPAAGA